MKNFGIIVVFLITAAYLYLLNTPINTASGPLPPLGKFLNPFSGFWQNAEAMQGWSDKENKHLDLQQEVKVCYDERLVPHVYAHNFADQAYMQGYLHAKYRLWQMDLTTRQASGRLAEVFGKRVLEIDRRHRRLGMSVAAASYAENWKSCEEYSLLQAYVDGVNRYIEDLKSKEFPLEFKLFDYQPEPWSTYKSALVMMSMNLVLCGRNDDIAATNSYQKLGKKDFEFLFPFWNPKQRPIIPSNEKWNFEVPEMDTMTPLIGGIIDHHFEQPSAEGVGSNNWAVSGSKTKSGHPILCNDPHLQLTLPSIWYEMHLIAPGQNTYGVTFPGIPQVIIGFNDHIAWGQTNVGMDVSDLYEIKWSDQERTSYLLDGEIVTVSAQIEHYEVKNHSTVVDTIKYTHWGPILSENNDRSLALHWLPNVDLDGCAFSTFFQLNKSENFNDYLEALEHFHSPPQNFVFASRTGDVAIKVQGKIPIKKVNQGRFIQDGSSSENEWNGYIAHMQTPMIKNPSSGFVASANQHSTDTTYPYYYHGYFEDYRSRSLHDQLSDLENVSVPDMQLLQNSTFSRFAADLCPLLLELIENDLPTEGRELFDLLSSWDHRYEGNSHAPIYFEHWSSLFFDETWDEFHQDDLEQLLPESWRTIALIEEDPTHPYFDKESTEEKESAKDIAYLSFLETVSYYDNIQLESDSLTWQDHRTILIPHLSRLPSFSAQNVKTGGTSTALNAVSPRNAPSWRMIVDLGNEIEAWGVYPGGESGNPGSPFYKTGIDTWANGDYFKLNFVKEGGDLPPSVLLFSEIFNP